LKNYDLALEYLDKSIALDIDDPYPIRNKFDTLIKASRNDEAVAFATENPTYFKTKYYRELLEKTGGKETMDKMFSELEQTTENKNAGTIEIEQENSGLQLYAHQNAAIHDMNSKILHKEKFGSSNRRW